MQTGPADLPCRPLCPEVSQGLHLSLSFPQQPPQVFPCVSLSVPPPPWPRLPEPVPLALPPPQRPPLAAARRTIPGKDREVLPMGCAGGDCVPPAGRADCPRLAGAPQLGALQGPGLPRTCTRTGHTHPYLGRRAADGARWGRGWGCPHGAGGPPGGSRWPRSRGPCWGTQGTTLPLKPPSGPAASCSLLCCRQACHL